MVFAFEADDRGLYAAEERAMRQTTPALVLVRARRLARRLGSDLRVVSVAWQVPDGYRLAPFCGQMALDWERRSVAVDPTISLRDVGGVLHEMGHVLACRVPPDQSDEVDFLGWEWAAARECGVESAWLTSMAGYQIRYRGHEGLWEQLSLHQQRDVLRERVEVARGAGLVDRQMRPLAVR